MVNSVILIGRLGHEPSVRETANTKVCTMSLVTETGYGEKKRSDWHNVVCFGKTAEFCEKYLVKGQLVYVSGSIRIGKYTNKDGKEVKTFDIYADDIKALEWKKEAGGKPATTEETPQGFEAIEESIPF